MKLISWNVNGIRACMEKGFVDSFNELNADIFCIQETKMQIGQAEIPTEGYHQYFAQADKKGYSGTAIFTREKAISERYDIGNDDNEGRTITLEFEKFYLVNVYTPNSKRELERLPYRMKWEDDFRVYLGELKEKKSVIVCGDLNVAHTEIDLKNPKTNRKSAGFSDEERAKMTELLGSGFIDTYRFFYPDRIEHYSWWSYMRQARDKNIGWRIDYFLASQDLEQNLVSADILNQYFGSDHCPVELNINL
ncbi:MAG: exodeoxyribonuclease III [Clostridia bacterium]